MSPAAQDWLHRLAEQLSTFLDAIAEARRAGQPEEAQALIQEAARVCLGMDYGALTSMDVLRTAELLTHPRRVEALARLLEQEAAVLRAEGEGALAEERAERAHMLDEEAMRLWQGEAWAP